MREEQAGWRAGDRLTFTYAAAGIVEPTAARVIRVLHDGLLVVECDGSGTAFAGFVIRQSFVVERLA
jgi:hypothetical protein